MAGEADRTEKITVNLGPVDLGRIDLLVQEGHFSTRTDFIRTAVRNQLERATRRSSRRSRAGRSCWGPAI